MRILYIGDIMAEPGRRVVSKVLPQLKKDLATDFVIAQAENIDDHGKGPRSRDITYMQQAGADFFTGGNHSFSSKETEAYQDTDVPLVRPANATGRLGRGYDIVEVNGHKILIASMLGQTVGARSIIALNPLDTADKIIEYAEEQGAMIRIFNFHGDFSSEKRVFGYYLDGRASAVIGDHWHVPTADAMIMPGGTAHVTDVGMCGTLHSSLGVKTSVIIQRWKTGKSSRNEIEYEGPLQFNALLIDVDEATGLAREVQHIQRIIESDR